MARIYFLPANGVALTADQLGANCSAQQQIAETKKEPRPAAHAQIIGIVNFYWPALSRLHWL